MSVHKNYSHNCTTTAFERLARRLKAYFPRLKILLVFDAMFATQAVMGQAHGYHWDYLIRFPKQKLKNFAKKLNAKKNTREPLPNQPYYRKRKQSFYWVNDISYGYDWELNIHLIACFEEYDTVNPKTGEIETCYVDHAWISSIAATQDNVHELINWGARKIGLMEFSINCEKNHGYRYKHAFSYDWNTMQSFHHLMRLGHAINVLSEFTKKLKKYIRDLGCNAVLSLIRETLLNPWLSQEWYEQQKNKAPQLPLQLE